MPRAARCSTASGNSGGFTVNCAATAKHVTACDISQPALDSVMRNARANGLSNIDTLCGDAFALLRDFRRAGKKFDLVILDPPAFCKTADEVKDACRGYKDINIQGMKLVKSGGFLITCSCSHYMSPTLFERMLAEAAKESGPHRALRGSKDAGARSPRLFYARTRRTT